MHFHLDIILLNSKQKQTSFQNTVQRTENRTKVVYACIFRAKSLSPVHKSEEVLSGICYFIELLENVFLIVFHLEETFSYDIHEVRFFSHLPPSAHCCLPSRISLSALKKQKVKDLSWKI